MNSTVTENTKSVLDRLIQDLRDLIESLQTPQMNEDSPMKGQSPKMNLTVYAVPQMHGDSPVKGQSPETKRATTLEEVRKVLVAKAREGKNDAVRKLLEHFHAASLPEVDPADYADLLELGRKL